MSITEALSARLVNDQIARSAAARELAARMEQPAPAIEPPQPIREPAHAATPRPSPEKPTASQPEQPVHERPPPKIGSLPEAAKPVADAATEVVAKPEPQARVAPAAPRAEAAPAEPARPPVQSAIDEAKSAESRRAPRKPHMMPALVAFDGHITPYPCKIRDMSTTGARVQWQRNSPLDATDVSDLPDLLSLIIRQDRIEMRAEVVWRREGEMGLRFLSKPQPSRNLVKQQAAPLKRR